jgi:hypothetical protein
MKTTAGNFALAESVVKGNADVVDLVRVTDLATSVSIAL